MDKENAIHLKLEEKEQNVRDNVRVSFMERILKRYSMKRYL